MEKKKLLIIGGSKSSSDIVIIAKKMGIYTIVIDWYDEVRSPAKKIADASYMISITEIDEIVELIKKENINGVITGFTDSYLEYYYEICSKSGLPCYGTLEQFNLCTNKENFKNICMQNEVPVIPEFNISNDLPIEQLKKIKYPVVVKPVDNSGSRGVFICYNEEEFIKSYEEALEYSPSKNVLVEKYIEGQGITWYYTIINGNPVLSAMTDTTFYFPNPKVAPMRNGQIFPSKYLNQYMKDTDKKVKNMIKNLKMENGVLFLQGFYDDGEFMIYEPGYRLNGGSTFFLIDQFCKYNQVEMLINYAITGKMTEETNLEIFEKPDFNEKYGYLLIIPLRPGKIKKIIGMDEVHKLETVLSVIQFFNEGDELNVIGTTKSNFAYIIIGAENKEELVNTIDKIQENVQVIDENNDNMICAKVNTEDIKLNY